MSSCNNVESLRGPIESLATKWENTTVMVVEFVNTLEGTQGNLQDQFAKMTIPEGLSLDENTSEKAETLREGYQEQLAGLADLSQSLSEFVGEWQEKGSTLVELQEGLDSGSLNSDAIDKVSDLEDTVRDAEGGLEEWRADLAEIQENTAGIFKEYNALIANAQGN